jgi:hypothetical protein
MLEADLPLDALRDMAPQERRLVHEAFEQQVANCMRREAFDYFPSPFSELPPPRRYGLEDVESATRQGYRVPLPGVAPEETRTARHLATLDAGRRKSWERALHGHPRMRVERDMPGVGRLRAPGGCLRFAEESVYGDFIGHTRNYLLLTQLIVQAKAHADRDPRVKSVLAAWRDCLNSQGYTATRQPAEMATLAHRLSEDEERAMAVADVRCKQASNLLIVWRAVESEAQHALARKHTRLIARWRDEKRTVVANAQRILFAP